MTKKHDALLNGKLVNPALGTEEMCNLLVAGGKLAGMGYIPDEDEDALNIIDISGCLIVPLSTVALSLGSAPSFTVIDPAKEKGYCRLTYVDGERVY